MRSSTNVVESVSLESVFRVPMNTQLTCQEGRFDSVEPTEIAFLESLPHERDPVGRRERLPDSFSDVFAERVPQLHSLLIYAE